MTDREQLAARIEAATGPDRELDCRIWTTQTGGNFDTYRAVVPDFGQWQAPHYTASLDAAMMLVDKDMDQTALTGLIVGAAEECYAQCGDLRRDLPRFLAAAAIRAGGA